MTDYDETNRGAIWKNDRKDTDKHPDFKGHLNVNGVEYWVSAWKRDPSGNPKAPALRFSIQPKEGSQKNSYSQSQAAQAPADFDSELPF